MNLLFWIVLAALVTLGHLAIWIATFNQLHATNSPPPLRKLSYPGVGLAIFFFPSLIFWIDQTNWSEETTWAQWFASSSWLARVYLPCCFGFSLVTLAFWIYRKWETVTNERKLSQHSIERHNFSESVFRKHPESAGKLWARIPGNQSLDLAVEKRTLCIPAIAPAFHQLKITHISDLHLTGTIPQTYFDLVVDEANAIQSDLIVITGDIIDRIECWDWLEETIGRLSAPLGIYFILGNHDRKIKQETRLRDQLTGLGFHDVSSGWTQVKVGAAKLHLCGNELPWFPLADDFPDCPPEYSDGDLRILLSHSPDQWSWARKREIELTLAGHCHGGQIRLPIAGPIVSPSRHGVRYASGFFESYGHSMLVTRGISGEEAIRLNCPPELAQVIIETETA